jgi:uncharacterized cupin superfamily protein
MDTILHVNAEALPRRKNRGGHPNYDFSVRALSPVGPDVRCSVDLYEIPPGKSNYPYHYHLRGEESFFILSGRGVVRTPAGEAPVRAGDYLRFPPGPAGAHKLTNTAPDEPLCYLDIDSDDPLDVAVYPDSNKVGVYAEGFRQIYRMDAQADYYDGE